MSSVLQFLFILLIILVTAKFASFLSIKLGQPSVLGELLAGILLGPTLLDLTNLPVFTNSHLSETIRELGELGVLLLMFIAGLELNLSDLAKSTRVSVYAGVLGVIFPVGLGAATGLLFGFDYASAIFLGLILGATSVSISAQTLMELDVLRTRVGFGLLGAAVLDDILVILLLSAVLAIVSGSGGLLSVMLILVRIFLYLTASVLLGVKLLPWLTRKVARMEISQSVLSLAIVILLFYGLTAELVGGMAAITGSFIAGLMFSRTSQRDHIERGIRGISYTLFVPVFFISIGLGINLREVTPQALLLLAAISVVGIAGKIVGAGAGALLGGFSRLESLQLGAGMVSRGEVGLIVAAIAMRGEYLRAEGFSAVIGMVIVTTLITPPLLRILFKRSETAHDNNCEKVSPVQEV